MLHEVKNEDGIKNFFTEMYETYVKVSLENTDSDRCQKVSPCTRTYLSTLFCILLKPKAFLLL